MTNCGLCPTEAVYRMGNTYLCDDCLGAMQRVESAVYTVSGGAFPPLVVEERVIPAPRMPPKGPARPAAPLGG